MSEDSKGEAAVAWTRKTPWKQGAVLKPEDAVRLRIVTANQSHDHLALVITHDCDLVVDDLAVEPYVEIVLGSKIKKCKPECSYARSTRTLHLEIFSGDGQQAYEFLSTLKQRVLKSDLATATPATQIDEASKRILQSWLAARYQRAALPDGLVERLRRLRETFTSIGKQNPKAILKIYIDYEPDRELQEGERYEVYIVVLYSAEIENAKMIAEQAAARIADKFERTFKAAGKWEHLELRSCEALSETELTYYDLSRSKEYRLEHMTLQANAKPKEPT